MRNKLAAEREQCPEWEAGDEQGGLSLCYEAPGKLVLRAISASGLYSSAEYLLPDAAVSGGELEIFWTIAAGTPGVHNRK